MLSSARFVFKPAIPGNVHFLHPPFQNAKEEIEGVLRKVMVRTERLAASDDRDGMLIENHVGQR